MMLVWNIDTDGIAQFEVTNGGGRPVYGQKDVMKFRLNITPDTTVTNTQYDEREYAVILTLQKKGVESETAFPEGTIFTYQGAKLNVGKDNRYVVVPVNTVGSHEVEIESALYGFDSGEYNLVTKLYSTTQEGYYNSIPVASNANDRSTATFTVMADPVYALKVEEKRADAVNAEKQRAKNHFIHAGESFDFAVTAQGGNADDRISVQVYRYEDGVYQTTEMSEIFDGAADLQTGDLQKWQPTVKAGSRKGTYRLAFTYHSKVEYWDFIISDKEDN